MFFTVIELWNAAKKAGKKSSLVICITWGRIRLSICRPYAFLRGPEQPTSRGWRICDEWGSIQSVIMSFFLQKSLKSVEWWLSCPSKIRRRYWPVEQGLVYLLKCWIYFRPHSFIIQPFSDVAITQPFGNGLVCSYHTSSRGDIYPQPWWMVGSSVLVNWSSESLWPIHSLQAAIILHRNISLHWWLPCL